MKNFYHLSDADRKDIFYIEPQEVTLSSPKSVIARALGATLYTPGTKQNLLESVLKQYSNGSGSIVLCLEDSIQDSELEFAEKNVYNFCEKLNDFDFKDLPLIFIRVRNPEHFEKVSSHLLDNNGLKNIAGFVFPKFGETFCQAQSFMNILKNVNESSTVQHPIYGMPIIESPSFVKIETRHDRLFEVEKLLSHDDFKQYVLAVRIGATDLASVYGIRRSNDITVYNVGVLSSTIYDIINVFGRYEDHFLNTGAVWEHFFDRERLFKPTLRISPFQREKIIDVRTELVMTSLDSFIREIYLDKSNGILGKTVIHPTHVNIVNGLQIVTKEEYDDAVIVNGLEEGGVARSSNRNKMNEGRPHYNWSQSIMSRVDAFGVFNEGVEFAHLLKVMIKKDMENNK